MREVLEDNIRLREKTEARFQAFFDKELSRLKNDFRTEAEVCVALLKCNALALLYVHVRDALLCGTCCWRCGFDVTFGDAMVNDYGENRLG